jgi:hypothetical protein
MSSALSRTTQDMENAMGAKTLPDASHSVPLPNPTRIKGRLYFSRAEIEIYKARVLATATGGEPIIRTSSVADELVPATRVARRARHSSSHSRQAHT